MRKYYIIVKDSSADLGAKVSLPGSLGNLLKKFFQPSKCSLLDRKSNIAKSQFLKIWFFDHFCANYNYGNAKTSIRGCTSAQIKTLRPYFSIFSMTVVRICLRKQQSKFFTNMLTTPSIEHVNIWFDSASPWILPPKIIFSKHQNKAEFKNLNDSEVPSCDFPGLIISVASMTSTASTTSMASMTSTASFHQKNYWF